MRCGIAPEDAPAEASASSMRVVPTTLTMAWRVASVSDCAVPVSAARWITTSGV